MGLSVDDLYDMTPRSFQNKLIGFNEHREQLSRNDWEQTRIIVHACLSPHTKKQLKPKQILPFPWDKKQTDKTIASKEYVQSVIEKYEKIKQKK